MEKSVRRSLARAKVRAIGPDGVVYEGTSSLQCGCPVCAYGEGWLSSFVPAAASIRLVQCQKCGTWFRALTHGPVDFDGKNYERTARDG